MNNNILVIILASGVFTEHLFSLQLWGNFSLSEVAY